MSPALPPAILHRQALVRQLIDVIVGPTPATEGAPPYKLVLLHAPAGYGKTTLLVDFARQTTIPCCWYLLDRSDTDTTTFLECLLASIRQRFPSFGAALDPLLTGARAGDANQRAEHRLETVVEALSDALATEIPERFALVLCNYHEVNESQEINHLINQLLRLPSACVVVIESRAIPNLEFAPLLTRRAMFGLGSDLLRLSAQEIRDLATIQRVAPLSYEEAAQLAESFDGWMAGILLGTRLGDVQFLPRRRGTSAPLPQGSSEMSADRQFLFAYVVNEVFTHHSDVYAFLKDACVLQEMTPTICDALLDSTDAAERLHYLEQHALFVIQSRAGSQIIYTCHPVLRELLADELCHQTPERFTMLHRRAAELLGAVQDYERAISHALAAGAYDLAEHFILEAYASLFAQGHRETLARWIDALPEPIRARSPKLLLILARLHCLGGDYPRAFSLLTTAREVITGPSPGVDVDEIPLVQAEIALARGNVLSHSGAYHEEQEICQQVLASLPADEVELRVEAHMRFGICADLLADFTSSIAHLQKALQLLGRQTMGFQVVEVHSALAMTYISLGNFALSEHHLARAAACLEQMQDEWGKVYNLIRTGWLKHYQGRFVEAETVLTQALTLGRATYLPRAQAYALNRLGELYQDQGLYERSLAASEEGLALARQVEDTYLTNYTLYILALSYLYMGDAVTAWLLVSETDGHTAGGEITGYERVIRELASGTILLHQHRYVDACAYLSRLEAALSTLGLRREQLQTWLRLAACRLAQKQISETARCLEEVATTLATYDGYKQVVLIELRRLPTLEQAVKALPEAAHLRTQLHLDTEVEGTKAPTQPVPPAPTPRLSIVHQPQLRILALGEPSVLLQEKPMTRWRMARAMELFFYLLDCGRPMRKEQIITALWPEVDEQIDHTFHSTIYYVRKALGESCIASQRGTYTLNLDSLYEGVWYDVAAFEDSFMRARQALARQEDAAATTALLAMVDLYRGDYVQPFYSGWCSFRRDELRRAYVDARCQLAQLAWRSEQFDESANHWQHLLAVDNCQEEAHLGLMRCYLRQGKRGLALRQYQRCRDSLQQELGVQPGPAIQHLYQRLAESPAR